MPKCPHYPEEQVLIGPLVHKDLNPVRQADDQAGHSSLQGIFLSNRPRDFYESPALRTFRLLTQFLPPPAEGA
jgi:hypothetical protein